MSRGNIHIGTSGWTHDGWIGEFYPSDIQKNRLLSFYAEQFETVEVNNSFYHLPDQKSVEHWLSLTPKQFVFSCNASRYITHRKKLKDPNKGLNKLFGSLDRFGDKLGPILFQLPGNWHFNKERLETFVASLPHEGYHYTFEFRDQSWLCKHAYDLLTQHNCALCFYDYKGYRSPETVTADFIYVRLHGPQSTPYAGAYDGRTLAGYTKKFQRRADEGKTVCCYFDNDQKSCAPFDARKLLERMENIHENRKC